MLQRLRLPAVLDGNVWRYANLASANRRHHHAELELNLVTHGWGTYLLGSRRYRIERGDLLWLFPAQEHVLIEQSADFAMWIAVFRRRTLKTAAIDDFSRPLLERSLCGEACRRLHAGDLVRFEQIFSELSAAGSQPGLMNAGLRYTLLHAWQCFQRAEEVPVREVHPAVERAARLILDTFNGGGAIGGDHNLRLEPLGRQAGLSPSRLSRLFKQQTGMSLVDFRNRQRVDRFIEVFAKGGRRNLLDAALEAGFGSYPQFHRVFRKHMGCTPELWRQRNS